MNYTYDILANFNEKFYDFYDWNNVDKLDHIKRLPILKVKKQFLKNIKYNEVTVEKAILDKIYKKTEFFKKTKKPENYICALCDGTEAIIIKLDKNGKVIQRSSMLIDEENEIIDMSEVMNTNEYEIKKTKTNTIDIFKTRKEKEIYDYIIKELKDINEEKLKYLYFDCFNKKENNIKKIKRKIKEEIKNNFEHIYLKIYEFLKLTSINS